MFLRVQGIKKLLTERVASVDSKLTHVTLGDTVRNSTETDYYQILGVIPSAETVVIKAAYRALASIYHPDKNPNPAAHEKTKAINEAYSVLSDPVKRSAYDKNRTPEEHVANSSTFDRTQPFTTDPLGKSWAIAVSFYPTIQTTYEDLGKISWRLAFAFKLHLTESQDYQAAHTIAQKMKSEYLAGYFGTNEEIVNYAERLIVSKEIPAALRLNAIVKVMGTSVSTWQVQNIIEKEFIGITARVREKDLYRRVINSSSYLAAPAADQLVERHGGVVKRSMWSTKVTLEIDGEYQIFANNEEYCKFLGSHFATTYA